MDLFKHYEGEVKRGWKWAIYVLLLFIPIFGLYLAFFAKTKSGKVGSIPFGAFMILIGLGFGLIIRYAPFFGDGPEEVVYKDGPTVVEYLRKNIQDLVDISTEDSEVVWDADSSSFSEGDSPPLSIEEMGEYEFERYVASIWEERGWRTEVTRSSSDQGIDVVATRNNPYQEKVLIQAKQYSEDNKVGSPEIQQYASLKQQEENVDQVIVVTSGYFSQQAEELADKLNVKLIDRDDLKQISGQE